MTDPKSKRAAILSSQQANSKPTQRKVKSRPIKLGERVKVCRLLQSKVKQ